MSITTVRHRGASALTVLAAAMVLNASTGCVTTETTTTATPVMPTTSQPTTSATSTSSTWSSSFTKPFRRAPQDAAPTGTPRQIQALWESKVVTTQDTVNQGRELTCLAGRLYLFGEQLGAPFRANGTVTVDCHEIQADGKMKMIERWEIDPVTLQKLLFQDDLGWGYTLYLPWSSYRPDIARVKLQAKFVPESGIPLFSPASPVTLNRDRDFRITSRVVPTATMK